MEISDFIFIYFILENTGVTCMWYSLAHETIKSIEELNVNDIEPVQMVFQIEPVEIKLRKWIQFRIEPVPHINFSDYNSRLDGPKIL